MKPADVLRASSDLPSTFRSRDVDVDACFGAYRCVRAALTCCISHFFWLILTKFLCISLGARSSCQLLGPSKLRSAGCRGAKEGAVPVLRRKVPDLPKTVCFHIFSRRNEVLLHKLSMRGNESPVKGAFGSDW